jgi:hypothetical protein
MKRPIIGYVACDESGPLMLGLNCSKEERSVLWHGNATTVFPTRRAARLAIERTKAYASEHGYKWGTHYVVKRLTPSPDGSRP